jgi:hypothetical protein
MAKKIDEKKLLFLMDNEFRDVFLSMRGKFRKPRNNSNIRFCRKYSEIFKYVYRNNAAYIYYKQKTMPIKNRYLIRFLKEYYPSKYSLLRLIRSIEGKGILECDLAAVLSPFMIREFKEILDDSAY